jgi:hypothetical protein
MHTDLLASKDYSAAFFYIEHDSPETRHISSQVHSDTFFHRLAIAGLAGSQSIHISHC